MLHVSSWLSTVSLLEFFNSTHADLISKIRLKDVKQFWFDDSCLVAKEFCAVLSKASQLRQLRLDTSIPVSVETTMELDLASFNSVLRFQGNEGELSLKLIKACPNLQVISLILEDYVWRRQPVLKTVAALAGVNAV